MTNFERRDGGFPRLPVLQLAILSASTVVAYAPSLFGPFVFDDLGNIVENESIQHFPPHLAWLNPASRPVVGFTFAINYAYGGLDVFSYRITNLLFHLLCGWLIAVLATQILLLLKFGTKAARPTVPNLLPVDDSRFNIFDRVSLLVGLWLFHPIASSAVAYIVQRSEILAACAIVGFQIAVIFDQSARDRRWQWIAAAIFAVGMFCKSNAISALPIALLLDRLLLSKSWREVLQRRGILYLLPLVLGIASLCLLMPGLVLGSAGVGYSPEIPSVPIYLATQCEVFWHYLWLCIWPAELCIDYRWPPVESLLSAVPGILLTSSVLFFSIWSYGRGQLIGWLMLTVFLLLAPTSTLIPITDIAVDHRMYLASSAVICLLIWAVERVFRHWLPDRNESRLTRWLVALPILTMLLFRTGIRADDWSTGFDLWKATALVAPQNPRALHNLTDIAKADGREAELLPFLLQLRAINLKMGTDTSVVASRLAEELMKVGDAAQAESLLKEAFAGLDPQGPLDERQELAAARINQAILLLQRGDLVNAKEQLDLALESEPKQKFAHAILGDLAFQNHDYPDAINHFERAIEIDPQWEQAKEDLTKARTELNRARKHPF